MHQVSGLGAWWMTPDTSALIGLKIVNALENIIDQLSNLTARLERTGRDTNRCLDDLYSAISEVFTR